LSDGPVGLAGSTLDIMHHVSGSCYYVSGISGECARPNKSPEDAYTPLFNLTEMKMQPQERSETTASDKKFRPGDQGQSGCNNESDG
jgi:hypothetical protein